MSSDKSNHDRITRNLRLAYGAVAAETISDEFLDLLRQIDDRDNNREPDSGIPSEPPKRPGGGPKSDAAAITSQRTE